MSLCEQYYDLKSLLDNLHPGEWFKMNGSYRFPVYDGWKSSSQINSDLHIMYVLDGNGTYVMQDGTSIELKKGTLVFITNDVEHYANFEPKNKLSISGLRFELCSNDQIITKEKFKPFYEYTHIKDYFYFNELTWRIHQAFHKGYDESCKRVCSAILYQLLYDLYENKYGGKAQEQFNSKMESARRMIVKNVYDKVSISQIAESLGISTRHFQKQFKLNFGYTPMEYYVNVRMDMALETLKNTNLSIFEVSNLFGYSDGFTFSKQFKKIFGYSPSEVRKNN